MKNDRSRFHCIWNGQKVTDMSGKTNDWMNIVNDFYQGMQFPNCIGAMDGKVSQIQIPAGSGAVFYNFRHFFSILLLI